MKKLKKIIQKEWKNTLEDFLAVIGLSLVLVKKRSGTPHTSANQTDPGIGLRRRRCKIPKGLVTNIPLYQCLGERTLKKLRRRKDNNTFHSK